MQCRVSLDLNSEESNPIIQLLWCVGFTYEKALYMPYTKLNAVFFVDMEPSFKAKNVESVRFLIDGYQIHYGVPDKVSIERCVYGYKVHLSSRGYTQLLVQNEPYPKINSNVDLKSLCSGNLKSNIISYEDPTPTVGNIYVKEGSNVWEAAVAYCIKASGRYPYIKGANYVCMSIFGANNIDYGDCTICEYIESTDSRMLLSDVYMQELEDDYPFEAHDDSAAMMKIVRNRYYPLDMQWLFDPQVGLQHKLDYSNRGVREYGLTYKGHKHEQLMDTAIGGGAIDGMKINYIKIVGNRKGVFTTVKAYDDRYGQK